MSKVVITKAKLDNLANTIGTKAGISPPLTITEMEETVIGIKTDPDLQNKTIIPLETSQVITADNGYDGLGRVTVGAIPNIYIQPEGTYLITENGYYNIYEYNQVEVNIPNRSRSAAVTPTENQQVITPGSGYDYLASVTVYAISSTYVGSGVARRSTNDITTSGGRVIIPAGYYEIQAIKDMPAGSATMPSSINSQAATISSVGTGSLTFTADVSESPAVTAGYISRGTVGSSTISLTAPVTVNPTPTASGPTVTIPAGYYSEQTTKSVATMTLPTSTSASATSFYQSLATIGRSTSDQYINISTGYNSITGYYKISAVPNGSVTAPNSILGGSASISTGVGVLTLTKTVSVTPNVTQAGYISSGTAGDSTVSLTANVTVDPTPTVNDNTVTIPAGYYTTIATKSVDSLTLPTSTSQSASSGYTSIATIGRSTSDQYINISKGYNNTKAYYKIPAIADGSVTPRVDKEAVYNHSVTVQSYADTSAGFIGNGTYVGNYVTITAAELVSGIYAVNTSGTKDVTNYASVSVPSGTEGTPSASKGTVTNNSIRVTPSVTNTGGWITGGTKNGTAVTVTAAELVSGTKSISANGTGIDVTNYATIDVAIPSDINNQNKTVTPTKSQQSVTADSGYSGLGTVTVNAIPAQYITTTDADATAAQILNTKTAYVNGSKVTGTMANNGAIGGTITTQGGTYTIPAGYTTGGTVTASLTASSITNTAINGTSFEEETGDYGFRTTVTIPAGYYNATTLTKEFSTILPAPETEGTSGQVLVGYDLYNHEGEVISGAMANNGTWNQTLNDSTTSVTIPAGYHSGSGTVSHTTVAIPNPTISINSSGVITASGSWTKGFTTNASYSNTKAMTTKAAATITPTESEQTAVAANVYTLGAVKVGAISSTYVGSDITQRSSTDLTASGATVSVPAGYYAEAASKSVTTMTLPTSAASSATSGYTSKATIGRSTSAQYINIPPGYNSAGGYYTISAVPNGTVTAPSSISGSSASVSTGTNTLTFTKTVSVTPNVTTAGYISSGTAGNVSVSLTASVTTKAAATFTPGTTDQIIAAGTYLTGAQTISGDADLVAANIKSGVSIFGVIGSYTGTIIDNQDKEVNPSESEQSVTFDSGYTGLGTVTVNPVSSTYVGSEITRRSSTDLTASGATVTVPAGYYESQASKAVSSMTLPTSAAASATSGYTRKATITPSTSIQYINIPTGYNATASYYQISAMTTMTLPTSAASSATSGYTSKATIGRSTSAQYINIPPGYNSTGAYYVISAVANGSVTAPSSISGTTATVSTGTNTLTLTKTVSVTPNVTTAGYISSGTAGNSSVSLTASVTTKAATTYNVSTSNQTIAAGTYLTGTQTIRAVTHTATAAKIAAGQTVTIGDAGSATRIANISGTYTSDATAIASDILEGETAYVNGSKITGSLVINTIYTGSSTPSSSLGMNGDIYIQSTGM